MRAEPWGLVCTDHGSSTIRCTPSAQTLQETSSPGASLGTPGLDPDVFYGCSKCVCFNSLSPPHWLEWVCVPAGLTDLGHMVQFPPQTGLDSGEQTPSAPKELEGTRERKLCENV